MDDALDLTPFHGPPASAPRIPGFTARTLLGFGAHGEVWLADELSTGEQVALKVGRRSAGPDPGADRETALLCRIEHPHVVRLRRVVPLTADAWPGPTAGPGPGQERGQEVALVLDLAAGGSLASLVAARGAFTPGEVSTLLVPLAEALDHLHRRGVVHGDIAPGNVLFTADGRPQLGDLGVARVLGARADGVWSTPGFTDPALTCAGAAAVDPRAVDLWGLAAVGWFALLGRPPQPGDAAWTAVADAVPGPLVATADAPLAGAPPRSGPEAAALSRLLAECLSPDPGARPALAELAERAWQAARPHPIQLIAPAATGDGEAGLPPLPARVTRRVVGADPAGPQTGAIEPPETRAAPRRGLRRDGGARPLEAGNTWSVAGRNLRRPALGVAAVGLASVVGVAWVMVAAGSGAGGRTATAAAGTPAADLNRDLTRSLVEFGRLRALAFSTVTARDLATVDESGSPAHRADLALVKRLRERGYRLTGVHYDVSGVRVLRHEGPVLDVVARVSTSRHLQVRTATRAATPVPADGPRALVFTVVRAPAGAWRVRTVSAAS